MKDFSQMTDEELDNAIIDQEMSKPSLAIDVKNLSDDDLDNMLAEKIAAEQAGPADRRGEAFAEGFGNAASFGYLPQIQAATEPLIQGTLDFFGGDNTDKKLKEQGFEIEAAPEDSYVQRRDKFIRRGQGLAVENPYSYGAGAVSGAISSGIATGGGLNKLIGQGTGMTGRFANAAKTGAAIGAGRNPGDTEGEVSPLQLKERTINAGKDALTGVVVQGGLEALSKGGRAAMDAGKNLKRFSEEKALKASGAMLKDFRKAVGKKKVAELGRTAIDEGLVGLGDDVADIAKNAEGALKKAGSRLNKVYDAADEALENSVGPVDFRVNTKTVADDFMKEARAKYKDAIDGDEIIEKLEKVAEKIRANNGKNYGELRKLRQSIDDKINFAKKTNDLPDFQEAMVSLRSKIQDQVKDNLGKLDPELKKQFAKENKTISNLMDLSKMSTDKAAREQANAAFGLRERMSGGTGAVVGGIVGGGIPGAIAGGIAGAVTTKVARQYGTPFVAMTANKVAKLLDANNPAIKKFSQPLIDAASKHPGEFVATVNALMKKPEFMKAVEDGNKTYYRGPAKK